MTPLQCSQTRRRELGAYEALWASERESLEAIAERFRIHEGARPSDFVPSGEIDAYAHLALEAIRDAGIERFGIRVHGAGDYPQKLRDAAPPPRGAALFSGCLGARDIALRGRRGHTRAE